MKRDKFEDPINRIFITQESTFLSPLMRIKLKKKHKNICLLSSNKHKNIYSHVDINSTPSKFCETSAAYVLFDLVT